MFAVLMTVNPGSVAPTLATAFALAYGLAWLVMLATVAAAASVAVACMASGRVRRWVRRHCTANGWEIEIRLGRERQLMLDFERAEERAIVRERLAKLEQAA